MRGGWEPRRRAPSCELFPKVIKIAYPFTAEKLVPKINIDHLVSEEEHQKAEQERKEFEAAGTNMYLTKEKLYPVYYESARETIAFGISPDEIRREMLMLNETPDLPLNSIEREAYDDDLSGLPRNSRRRTQPISRVCLLTCDREQSDEQSLYVEVIDGVRFKR
jgi:hypothetical protein